MRVQGGQLVRATGSCRCAHHSAPASLPPPALAHVSLALCAFAHGSLFLVWLRRRCRRRGILRRCKTHRRRAVCRAWRRGWAWLAK